MIRAYSFLFPLSRNLHQPEMAFMDMIVTSYVTE